MYSFIGIISYNAPQIVWLTDTTSTATATSGTNASSVLNTTLPITGSSSGSWYTNLITNQRFSINRTAAIFFNRIRIVNYHNSGSDTISGIKKIKIFASDSFSTSFTENNKGVNSWTIYYIFL